MPTLDLIVTASWIGLLTAVLVARSVFAWLRYRHAARFAREAALLADATRPAKLAAPKAAPVHLRLVTGDGGVEAEPAANRGPSHEDRPVAAGS